MSQVTTYTIGNLSGAAFRAALNAITAAIRTLNSGAAAPTETAPYMLWVDTSNAVIMRRNSADSAWVLHDSAVANATDAKSGAYTAVKSDHKRFIRFTGSGGFTLAFTAAATLGEGWLVMLRNDSTGTITLDPNGTEQIDGGTTLSLLAGQSCWVVCTGSAFYSFSMSSSAALTAAGKVQSITATMASNIITTTVQPTSLDFRSSTLTTGAPNTRTLGSVDTVTIPALASLGVPTGQSGRIVRLLIDNGGTLEGAVINLAGGVNLDETGLISTTAISGTATSANVAYSTTARTNVPYRVVGFFDAVWTSGTGWSAPTLVQGQGGQALAAMQSLGYGQTWQTVTRTSGVTYYNQTGKPLELKADLTVGVGGAVSNLTVSGSSVGALVGGYNNSGTQIYSGSTVIPVGASYSLSDSGAFTARTTYELR